MSARPYSIGLLGCGTVGAGVMEILLRRRERLENILSRPIVVRRVAVRDPSRPRPAHVPRDLLTTNTGEVVDDPGVDVVVEVMGGVEPAASLIAHALYKGKDVVTANKAALAEANAKIYKALYSGPARLRYEGAVGGAIPIVKGIEEGLVGNDVTLIVGILNGTCNYVLTLMEEEKKGFAEALRQAQAAGFAEADPALDISGQDTAHKLSILVTLMARKLAPWGAIFTEGIERITADDMAWAAALDMRIKLLGIARMVGEEVDVRVHPTLIPRKFMLAAVRREFNAVYVRGDAAGPQLFYGRGAGGLPTASAVVCDLIDLARTHAQMGRKNLPLDTAGRPFRAVKDLVCRNYLRMRVPDRPGVIGRIATHFGERGISIATMSQPEARGAGGVTDVIFTTHPVKDAVIASALAHVEKAGIVLEPATRIRVETFDDEA